MRGRDKVARLILVAVGMAVLGTSCSSDPAALEPVTSDEAMIQPTWIQPACSSTALTSPPGTCQAPWRYKLWDTRVDNGPQCVDATHPASCTQYSACDRWENGISFSEADEPGIQKQIGCEKQCSQDGPGVPVCETLCDPFDKVTWCENARAARELAIENATIALPIPASTNLTNLRNLIQVIKQLTSVSGPVTHVTPLYSKWKVTYTCAYHVHNKPNPANAPSNLCSCATMTYPDCAPAQLSTHTIRELPPGSGAPIGTYVYDSACLSCDGVGGTGTAADLEAKATCLISNSSLPDSPFETGPLATTPASSLRDAARNRAKLLLELYGDQLSSATRAQIYNLYDDSVSAPVCQQAIPSLDACANVAGAPEIQGHLQACSNLAAATSSAVAAGAMVKTCTEVVAPINAITNATCKATLFAQADAVMKSLVERVLNDRMQPDANPNDDVYTPTGVADAVAALDNYYRYARTRFDQDEVAFQTATAHMIARFWSRAYATALPTSGSGSTPELALGRVLNASTQIDEAVLNAVFSSDHPATSSLVLVLAADALDGFRQQLDVVTPLHDLSCRYSSCLGTSTATSESWALFAALGSASSLDTQLSSSSHLSAVRPGVVTAFQNIQKNYIVLDGAWHDAGGSGSLPADEDVDVPPVATRLVRLLRDGDGRMASYRKVGLFEGSGERLLQAGMQHKDTAIGLLSGRLGELTSDRAQFIAERTDVLNHTLTAIQNGGSQQNQNDRMAQLASLQEEYTRRIVGLKARAAENRAAFANAAERLQALMQSGAIDTQAAIQATPLPPEHPNAHDARATAQTAFSMAAVAMNSQSGGLWTRSVSAGQMLRFSITGNWGPSCAIQLMPALHLDGTLHRPVLDRPITGPEGYWLQASSSGWTTSSVGYSSQHQDAYATTDQRCNEWHAGGGAGTISYGLADVGSSHSSSTCHSHTVGDSTTHSSDANAGTDDRYASSLSAGIRVDSTPIPWAPAGSLVLVSTQHGNSNIILDTQVLGSQSVAFFPTDADLYLVVNDVTDPSCVLPDDRLNIDATLITPTGTRAQQLLAGMAVATTEMSTKRAALVEQGELLSTDITGLQQMAMLRVSERTGIAYNDLPGSLRGFFDTWMTTATGDLEASVHIATLEKELHHSALEFDALEHELQTAQTHSHFNLIGAYWALRALDSVRWLEDSTNLTRTLEREILPVFELRFRKKLDSLRTANSAKITALRTLAPGADPVTVMDTLTSFASTVQALLNDGQTDTSDFGTKWVSLSYMNPNYTLVPPYTPPPLAEQTPQADLARARSLFDAINARGVGRFEVRPTDFYSVAGRPGGLVCTQSAPIIRRMALAFVMPAGSVDVPSLHWAPSTQVASAQVFPTIDGPIIYRKEDEDWLSLAVPTLGAQSEGAILSTLATTVIPTVGDGHAPFTTFDVNFGGLPLDSTFIAGVMLVMEVDYRPLGAPGAWVPGVCNRALP